MLYFDPESTEAEAEQSEDFQVAKVINHRWSKGRLQYFVKWKGLDESENSWEDEESLNCTNLIDAYVRSKAKTFKQQKIQISSEIPTGAELTVLQGLRIYDQIAYKTKDERGVIRNITSEDAKKLCPFALLDFLEKFVDIPTKN